MFSEHATEFAGLPVKDFGSGLSSPKSSAYRIRVGYDDEQTITELFSDMLSDPAVDQLAALVIGAWAGEDLYEATPSEIVEALIAAADQFAQPPRTVHRRHHQRRKRGLLDPADRPLAALGRVSALEYLQIRGSAGLSLGRIEHAHLKSLTIECGGLLKSVLAQVVAARLPSLEHLELYLGTEGYGWNGAIDDVRPLVATVLFPKLKYLGLRDSGIADQVAGLVGQSPLMKQISTLDLSLGTLGDEGARALLSCGDIRRLKLLDLHHHYMSKEVMAEFRKAFEGQSTVVNLDDRQDEGRYGRYVSVGE